MRGRIKGSITNPANRKRTALKLKNPKLADAWRWATNPPPQTIEARSRSKSEVILCELR
jgi:hypothetical protein